jgi:hypothetical protein
MLVESIFVVNAKDSAGRRMVVVLECVVIYIRLESIVVLVQIVVGGGIFC